jgi:hypothetical protein
MPDPPADGRTGVIPPLLAAKARADSALRSNPVTRRPTRMQPWLAM